jgi:hypothetical protein
MALLLLRSEADYLVHQHKQILGLSVTQTPNRSAFYRESGLVRWPVRDPGLADAADRCVPNTGHPSANDWCASLSCRSAW